jgi:hypothetical protein
LFASNIIGSATNVFMVRARNSGDIAGGEAAAGRGAEAADLGAGLSFDTCEIA